MPPVSFVLKRYPDFWEELQTEWKVWKLKSFRDAPLGGPERAASRAPPRALPRNERGGVPEEQACPFFLMPGTGREAGSWTAGFRNAKELEPALWPRGVPSKKYNLHTEVSVCSTKRCVPTATGKVLRTQNLEAPVSRGT